MTHGAVTAETHVGPGRARVDFRRGDLLPDDVPAEDIATLLARGHIAELDGPGVDADGDGVPEGSAAQVMQWVGQGDGVAEQRRRAVAAYNAEGDRGEHARKTLLAALEKLVRELDEA